jgi:thiol-disulfide isomerase/thioredoxin
MTVLHVLFLSSAVSWLLLIGLAVSVVRIEKLVLGMRTGQEPQDDGPALGSVAPEFADPEPIRPVNLGRADAMRGVPQLYWFMRTNCAPCLHLRPLVEAIASEYEDKVCCWVNCVGPSGAVEELAGEWDPIVRVVFDRQRTNATRWGVRRVPSVVLVGCDGVVAWKGRASREPVERALTEVLEGRLAAVRT